MSTNISDRGARDRILRLLWTTTFGSLAVYLWLGHKLEGLSMPELAVGWSAESLLSLFYAATIGLFAVIIVLRTLIRRMPETATDRHDTDDAVPATADTQAFALSVVMLALAESIALLGLILYWLVRARSPFYLLLTTAFAALLVARPQDRATPPTGPNRSSP